MSELDFTGLLELFPHMPFTEDGNRMDKRTRLSKINISKNCSGLKKNMSDWIVRFFGPLNNRLFIKALESDEDKGQALSLIKQELLGNDSIIRGHNFDQASESAITNWIEMYLDQNVSFGCFTCNGRKLVAVDCLYVRKMNDRFPELTEEWHMGIPFISIKYMTLIERQISNFSRGSQEYFLTSFGVFTSPSYRNFGIPREMIEMRSRIARTLQIEVISSAFIWHEMLEAARRNNYQDLQIFNGSEDMMEVD